MTLVSVVGHARAASADDPLPDTVRFNRDIRPIFSDTCFKCHGFDAKERKAELRLDTPDGIIAKLKEGDGFAVVPGQPAASEVYRRITTDDRGDRMPPAKSGKVLTDRHKALIKRWIEQGAQYEAHWAFIPPVRPVVPNAGEAAWNRSAIDAFILDRLKKAGLKPSPEADKATLIRRVTLDLTGLPPTPAEVDAFLKDECPDAYERLVDELMSRVTYGERMALDWLDAARYADTNGYHIDNGRDQTRWREWVIDAFHENKPYDQFVVEQFAGDLLPSPTTDQLIGTGFHRNHMINFEGGADPVEYHTAYIIDRVNTVGTVFLGLGVGCAQCHDHKFDPVTMRDYYALYAFFNNVPENGIDGRKGNSEPMIRLPSLEHQAQLDALSAKVREAEEKLTGPDDELDRQQLAWEQSYGAGVAWTAAAPQAMRSAGGAEFKQLEDKSIVVSGANPPTDTYTITLPGTPGVKITGIRLQTLTDPALAGGGPGRSSNGNVVLTDLRIGIEGDGAASPAPVKVKAAVADYSQNDFPVAHAIDDKPNTGWAIYPEVGKPHDAVFELDSPLTLAERQRLTITLDFQSPYGQHQLGKFRLSITDSSNPRGTTGLPPDIASFLSVEREKRSAEQVVALRTHFRTNVADVARTINDAIARLKKEREELEAKVPTAMVMKEQPGVRQTFMLVRGDFAKRGEPVTAATPAFLPPMDPSLPKDRLGLARWLVSPEHPLLARVTVNRYWQMFFGPGLVKTAEDFGSQGELPSHPELLDWLAVEFQGSGWDVRRLVKLIVTSSTYRQSSAIMPETYGRDPENRLLARGPRFRLQAEFIRDQALAVSGLLDRRVGGASVFPYQPPGLWEELMERSDGANWTAQTYTPSKGADLYRRSMYTFWKRTNPPPALSTFDAPDRETCTVRRARTNTPLQALVLMNDPTYVEASRKLAVRMMNEGGASADERITFAFRLATARPPGAEESAVLRRVFEEQLKLYAADPDAAAKLLSVGESPRDQNLPVSELAAWTTVASVILNLDETVTRN